MRKYVRGTLPEIRAELNRRLVAELEAAPKRYAHLLEAAEGEEEITAALEEIAERTIGDCEKVAEEHLEELRAAAVELPD